MKDTYVVHLTPAHGLQASARIARFIAGELGVPLLDDEASIARHFPLARRERKVTLYFVNGPIAFSGIRDALGTAVLPYTKRVIWCQNDYTIGLPPNKAYSRPTNAVTPFRKEFHAVPEVSLWTTCWDFMGKFTRLPGGVRYINWNALTYAPFRHAPIVAQPRVLYYGALRAGRMGAIAKLLNSDRVHISLSRDIEAMQRAWHLQAPAATQVHNITGYGVPVAHNGNTYGAQPLLPAIANYRHSVYMADAASNSGAHSLANRFYEVLSTPGTVLWLDSAGAACYDRYGMTGWRQFSVSESKDWDAICLLSPAECAKLALLQRKLWLGADPYISLKKELHLNG